MGSLKNQTQRSSMTYVNTRTDSASRTGNIFNSGFSLRIHTSVLSAPTGSRGSAMAATAYASRLPAGIMAGIYRAIAARMLSIIPTGTV